MCLPMGLLGILEDWSLPTLKILEVCVYELKILQSSAARIS